jgi:hypothetical protein
MVHSHTSFLTQVSSKLANVHMNRPHMFLSPQFFVFHTSRKLLPKRVDVKQLVAREFLRGL